MARTLSAGLLIGVAIFTLQAWAQDADGTYTNGSGNWSDSTRWQGGLVATGVDKTATFKGPASMTVTVTNDTSRIIGNLVLNHTSGAYTFTLSPLDGTVFLTLATTPPAAPLLNGIQGASLSINTPLLGTQGVVKAGTQPIILGSTESTYGGDTVITQGALRVAVSSTGVPVTKGPLGVSRLVLKTGGTLQSTDSGVRTVANELVLDGDTVFDGGQNFYGGLTFAGPITLTGSRTLQSVNVALTFQGVCSDGGSNYRLTKTGGGSLTMTGPHTYGGGTVLNGGTIYIGANSAGAPITAGPLGKGPLSMLSGILANAGPNGSTWRFANPASLDGDMQFGTAGNYSYLYLDSPVSLTGNRLVTVTTYGTSYPVYLNGGVNDNGGGFGMTLRVTGGIFQIGGSNAIGGGVCVWEGPLILGAGSVWNTPAITLPDYSNVLRIQNAVASNSLLPQIVFSNSNPTIWVQGVASGGPMSVNRLTRLGRATLTVAGTAAGIAKLAADDKLLITNGAPAIVNGMVPPYLMEYTGDFLTYDNSLGLKRAAYNASNDVNAAAATALFAATNAQTLTDNREVYALKTGFNLSGGYDLTLSSGGLSLNAGTPVIACNLQFSNKEALVWNNVSAALNGVVKGTNGFTKWGSGTLVLSNANVYTGPTTVNAGTLKLGTGGSLAAGQTLVVNNGGTFDLNGQNVSITNLTMFGGTLQNNLAAGACTLSIPRDVVYGGTYRQATISAGPGTHLTLQFSQAPVFNVADGYAADDMVVYAAVTGGSGLRKTGWGTLSLMASNLLTLAGTLTVEGGTLKGQRYANGEYGLGAITNSIVLRRNAGILVTSAISVTSTNDVVSYAGGNLFRLTGGSGGQSWEVTRFDRVAGSRGTMCVGGTHNSGAALSFGNNSNNRLWVTAWAVTNRLPAYFIQVRNPFDTSYDDGRHLKNKDVSVAYGVTEMLYTAGDINSSTAATMYEPAAVQTVTNATASVFYLRTLYDILGTGKTLIVAGDAANQAGVIVNDSRTIAPKVKFGAAGDLEGCVFVRNLRTAILDGGVETTAGLTKFGAGTLRLTQDSSATYTGGTYIQAGTLQISNAAAMGPASNPVLIQKDAALQLLDNYTLNHAITGEGMILTSTNLLTLGASGTLTPGTTNETGTLTVGNLAFQGTYNWNYDGTNSDLIATASLTFSGAPKVNVTWSGTGPAATGSYTLFTYTGADPSLASLSVKGPVGRYGTLALDPAGKRVLFVITGAVRGTAVFFR